MVSADNKANVSRVTDLKAARIEKNLKRLAVLVNSSLETKKRTEDYLMALTPAEKQRKFKATRKQLNIWIQPEAHALLLTHAKEQKLSQATYLESLLHQATITPDAEIIALKAELLEAETLAKNVMNESLELLKENARLKKELP